MKHPSKLALHKPSQSDFRRIGFELTPIITLLFAFFIELRHITSTLWKGFFLGQSDMLTLPLVSQSIHAGEPFHWVFSSQIFLFPESILYGISELITPNFRLALIVNAFINCLILYLLFRWIAASFSQSRRLVIAYAFLASLLVILMATLEPHDGPQVITFFLVTTAYYGVIISAVASVAVTTMMMRRLAAKSLSRRQLRLTVVGLFLISALTSLSNPLYVLQFVLPLAVVVFLAVVLNNTKWRMAALILLPQLVGAAFGIASRSLFFKRFFSSFGGVGNYLHFSLIGSTIDAFHGFALQMIHGTLAQKVEIFIIGVELAASLGLFVLLVHYATRQRQGKKLPLYLSDRSFLVAGLAGLTPILVFVGTVVTGNALPRYLLPMVIFPLIAGAPLLSLRWRIFSLPSVIRGAQWSTIGIAVLVGLIGLLSHPVSGVKAVSSYDTSNQRCLDNYLSKSHYSVGVAQYWRARGLQLNSRQHVELLQTYGSLNRFTWLYNRADYDLYNPDFVIVDKAHPAFFDPEVSLDPGFAIYPQLVVGRLGQPDGIYSCPSFSIYSYPADNPGHKQLETIIRDPNAGL